VNGNVPRRGLRWIALGVFISGLFTLVWFVALSNSGSAAMGLLLGVGQLGVAALTFRLASRAASASVEPRTALTRAADALAASVRRQWNDEIGNRRLRHPRPLQLCWEPVRGLAAPPPNIVIAGGRLEGADSIDLPASNLVREFRALPTPQLLILGEPGAGKSTLAILFVLAALGRATPGNAGRVDPAEPVPVLLTLVSWNPELESIRDWVARRIAEDYPELRNTVLYGPAAPHRLVDEGLVLPVLDGLDELPATLITAAIDGLNDVSGRGGLSTVVLSRRTEYETAVAATSRLSQAAVLDIQRISVQDSIEFLTAPEPTGSTRWDPVTTRMRADPTGPLAAALSTPLMTSLARTVYGASGNDPGDLCTLQSATAIENHLLERLLPTAYPRPDAELTRRSLALLAHHLEHRLQTTNLAWWQLHRLLPRAVPVVLVTVLLGILTAILALVAKSLTDVRGPGSANGLVRSLAAMSLGNCLLLGLAFGLAAGFVAAVNTLRSSRRQPGHQSRSAAIWAVTAATLRDGLSAGLILAASTAMFVPPQDQFWFVTLEAMVFGALGGVAVSILLQGLGAGRGLTPSRASFRLRTLLPEVGGGHLRGLLFGVLIGGMVGLLVTVDAIVDQNDSVVLTGLRSGRRQSQVILV